jgi:hypothetical protein
VSKRTTTSDTSIPSNPGCSVPNQVRIPSVIDPEFNGMPFAQGNCWITVADSIDGGESACGGAGRLCRLCEVMLKKAPSDVIACGRSRCLGQAARVMRHALE